MIYSLESFMVICMYVGLVKLIYYGSTIRVERVHLQHFTTVCHSFQEKLIFINHGNISIVQWKEKQNENKEKILPHTITIMREK